MRKHNFLWRHCRPIRSMFLLPTTTTPVRSFVENLYQRPHGEEEKGEAPPQGKRERHHPGADPYEQFQSQRQSYYKHSFYEKGTAAPGGQQSKEGEEEAKGPFESTDRHNRFKYNYRKGTSAHVKEKREMSQHWENAFFGRVHYEEGMHERYRSAIAAEEEEQYFKKKEEAEQSGENMNRVDKTIIEVCRERFPSWEETDEVPRALFKTRLAPHEQLQFIIYKLTFAQRRLRFAADYGSGSMMYQLHLGEQALAEAESLLQELGWMNDTLEERIAELRQVAFSVKFEFDLD